MQLSYDCSGQIGKTCFPLAAFFVLVAFVAILCLGLGGWVLKRRLRAAGEKKDGAGGTGRKWCGIM